MFTGDCENIVHSVGQVTSTSGCCHLASGDDMTACDDYKSFILVLFHLLTIV